MIGLNLEDYIYLFLPLVSGYTVSAFCAPTKSAASNIKFRPPSWIFGIVWPILYILIGLAWINSKEYSLYFFTLIILLNLWLITYVCQKNKIGGIYILLLSLLTTLLIYTSVEKFSKYLISPLFIWLLFATLLNIFEVQMK